MGPGIRRDVTDEAEVLAVKLSRFVGIGLLVLLSGYAMFDRGFAYFHVPKTPLFLGEILLAAGLLMLLVGTPHARAAVAGFPPFALLLVFVLWCAARALPFVPVAGIDAFRDSSIWYYSFFAVIVVTLLDWRPELLSAVVRWYLAFIPWLFAAVLLHLVTSSYPNLVPTFFVPDSQISVLIFKPGNLAIQCAIAVGVLWLLPLPDHLARRKWIYSGIGLLLIAAIGTQNRGGMLAALAGVGIVWLFARDRARIALVAITLVSVALGTAYIADLKLSTGGAIGDRAVSVDQLVTNISSLTGSDSEGSASSRQLAGTVEWRDELWHRAIALRDAEGHALDGLGFGRNLGEDLGFASGDNTELRSPHNSHVDILVRTGWIGFAFWCALWLAWALMLLGGRKRYRPGTVERALIEICLAGVVAMMINAYFDPSLESPQVALWLWSLFGLGAWLVARARRPVPAPLPAWRSEAPAGTDG